ncbi:MAG: S8 family serine peptidase [Candidatus Zixiibacteriota bacterium]
MLKRLFAILIAVFTCVNVAHGRPVGMSNIPAKTFDKQSAQIVTITRPVPVKPSDMIISDKAKPLHVVVKFRDDLAVRLVNGQLPVRTDIADAVTRLNPFVSQGRFHPLITLAKVDRLDRQRASLAAKANKPLPDMASYYRVMVDSPREASTLVAELNRLPEIEIAYFEPQPEPAGWLSSASPNYQPNQDYREAAPTGVDADFANGLTGGDGAGVMIVDIEGAWRTTHEDLTKALNGVIAGVPTGDLSFRNHGTAVLGEMIADNNGSGVTGICPGADIGMASVSTISFADAVMASLDTLKAGDIILIELHSPGPRYNFQTRSDQLGYVCMEYWQANFDALLYAWAKGVIVVEAAGNGAENFDDVIYNDVFDTTYRNSHAVIVGAGWAAASAGNLQRINFSNYGERVNLQGYGNGVYTTGYGDLYSAGGENFYYTATFSGTSSASPIIAGSVACLQGRYKNLYGVPLNSDEARELLVSTGTAQLGNTSQHIGPRPNLAGAFAAFSAPPSLYTTPSLVEDTVNEGASSNLPLWIHNRHASQSFDFTIVDADSFTKSVMVDSNWLVAVPTSGTIAALDSIQITVTLNATIVPDRIASYRGILDISWGPSGGGLDSLTRVPAYMKVPCNDVSYEVLSSADVGGPTFNWISAKTLGFKIANGNFYNTAANPLDDGSAGPWPFYTGMPFFDAFQDSFYVGVNGGISYTDNHVNSNGFFEAFSIPGATMNTFVAALWNDLIIDTADPNEGVYIYYSPKKDTTVIEWYKIGSFNNTADTTIQFEMIVCKNGTITLQYQNVGTVGPTGTAATSVVGIQQIECRANQYFKGNDIPARIPSPGYAVRYRNLLGQYIQSGNINGMGGINVVDLTSLVAYLFSGGPAPNPIEMGNVNCTGAVNIVDLTYLVAYLFQGGPAPCFFWKFN